MTWTCLRCMEKFNSQSEFLYHNCRLEKKLRRPCRRCDNYFVPPGKKSRVCEVCKLKPGIPGKNGIKKHATMQKYGFA